MKSHAETETDSSLETRFVLPADVVLLPVAQLAESLRNQIPHQPGDVAVSRPRMRRPSQIVAPETARLLAEFRTPSRIAEAVARYSRAENTDPFSTLEAAFEALQSFTAGRLLVPEDSDLVRPIEASFVPGQTVAGCEIVRLVQSLEDTELYQALHVADARSVALKITRPQPTPATAGLLAREAAVLRHLRGHVAPALVAEGEWERRRFLACAWQTGLPVSAVASKLRRAPDARGDLHRLCREVGEAFALLHERHVVHGDVHPGNVLSGASIVLLDYGLSRLLRPDSPYAAAPRSGVAFYYEPELAAAQLAGEPPPQATPLGEQYALAVLLYQLLTGHYPQDFALTAQDFLPHIVSAPVIAFSRRGVEPWPEIETVLARALSKDPGARFASIRDFVDAFSAAAAPHHGSSRAAVRRDPPARSLVEPALAQFDWDGPWFRHGLPPGAPISFCQGAAGVAYFLHRVAVNREDPALLALADAWAQRADATPPPSDRAPLPARVDPLRLPTTDDSPFHGAPGLHAVRALIAHARGDRRSTASAIEDFHAPLRAPRSTESTLTHGDLFLGRTGAALVAGQLHRTLAAAQLQDLLAEFIEHSAPVHLPRAGGMAHGAHGFLHAVLHASKTLRRPPPAWTLDALDRLASARELPDAGWCRGTAGSSLFWTFAHECTGAEDHLRLAERAAAATSEHPDASGNLCCGLAGRGFALLRYYQLTGERRWLDRARRLAALAADHAETTQGAPWSLFKGPLGLALLENELDAPENAALPFLG